MLKFWWKISNIGIRGAETDEEKKYIHLINQIIFFATLFTPAFIPLLYLAEAELYVVIQTIFSFLCPIGFLFTRKGKFITGFMITLTFVNINVVSGSVVHYHIGGEYLLFPISLLSFMVFRKMVPAVLVFLFTVSGFFIGQALNYTIEPLVVLRENNRLFLFESILFMSFFICAVIILNFKTVLGNYEVSLMKQKGIIEEKNKEITDSIRYAKRIQQASMPAERYIEKILNNFKVK
jgi:phosphoserine phosphatase RsbU/P